MNRSQHKLHKYLKLQLSRDTSTPKFGDVTNFSLVFFFFFHQFFFFTSGIEAREFFSTCNTEIVPLSRYIEGYNQYRFQDAK